MSDAEDEFVEKLLVMPHSYQLTEHERAYEKTSNEPLAAEDGRRVLRHGLVSDPAMLARSLTTLLHREISADVSQIHSRLAVDGPTFASFQAKVQWLDQRSQQGDLPADAEPRLNAALQKYRVLQSIRHGDQQVLAEQLERYVEGLIPKREFLADRFAFCSLNNQKKIARRDLRAFRRVLEQAPNSVLLFFLYVGTEARENILAEFGPSLRDRIAFVGATDKRLHLLRLRTIDCVLDTFHYGAHTSAGDAIWSGVPIVTMRGQTVETRVCASMLTAAGLESLVTSNEDEYVERAVELATDRTCYEQLRAQVRQARNSPLFDRKRYIAALGDGYRQAWQRFCAGLPPEHIVLT